MDNEIPTEERARLSSLARLLVKCRGITYRSNHDEGWRNKLAAELNVILGRVEWTLETDGCDSDIEFAEAALRIVERVADFEEIGTK